MRVRFGALLEKGGLGFMDGWGNRGPVRVAVCGRCKKGTPKMGPNRRADDPHPLKSSEKGLFTRTHTTTHPPAPTPSALPHTLSLITWGCPLPCPCSVGDHHGGHG